MKTLIIGPNDNPPRLGHYSSGLDRVAQEHANQPNHWLLTTEGDDIHPRQVKLGRANITFAKPKGAGEPHLRKRWTRENHEQYDRFIYHGNSSTIIKELCRLGRGADIEAWLHTPDVMSTWAVNFNSGVGLVKTCGGKVIAVSERLQKMWDWWHRYQIERERIGRCIVRPDLLNGNILHDPFVDEIRSPLQSTYRGPVKAATLPGIVLSRMAAEKKIERAFGNGLTFVLATTSRDYRPDLSSESTVIDAPYSECMNILAESAFLVSTWEDETYGLNALEAAERGVPCILVEGTKGNPRWGVLPHASRSFLPEWAYITCPPDGVKDAIARIPTEWHTLQFRQRLATYVRENR